MKTIAMNRTNTTRALFVLAALGAFYFYRRQGGSVNALWSRGADAIRTGREMLSERITDLRSDVKFDVNARVNSASDHSATPSAYV